MRLYVRRRVPDIQQSLLSVIDALVTQAASAGDAVMPSYTHVRRAQPVPGRALPAGARRSAATRCRSLRRGARRGRRDAARRRRHRRHQLRGGHDVPGTAAGLHEGGGQQHRCHVGPRLRQQLPARLITGDGAPEPAGRGRRALHRRGVRLLRALRRGGHRQQPDAAEEEPRSDGTGARQVRPRPSATSPAG